MAHKIFTYDTSKTTGGRNNNKATMMIKQTEINLLENKKQAPFTGYSGASTSMKESFVSNKNSENNNSNESFNLSKFLTHTDLEQRDKALTKFIQENVSKQITQAIEKFKTHGIKEFVDKTAETQKEEFDSLRKMIKNNEETIKELQNEKVNYAQTLSKIELVLERQFASATAAGSFASYKDNQQTIDAVSSQMKEDIKAIQLNMKNLKETIMNQINDQLTLGFSTLSMEQEKIRDSMNKFSKVEHSLENMKKFEEKLDDFEKKIAKFNEALDDQKQNSEANSSKFEEILKILKTERQQDGQVYEANIKENERIKTMENKLENCLIELLKTKEHFEETLTKKLDSSIFETFKIQEKNEYEEVRVEKKPAIESVFIEKKEPEERFVGENVDEKIEVEKQTILVNTTPMKEFQKTEVLASENKRDGGYEDWLAQNRDAVNLEIEKKGSEIVGRDSEFKRMLEGEEVISEINKKEEELNSEIQRDFESINNAIEKKVEEEEQKRDPTSPEKDVLLKYQGSESVENEDEAGEIVYNIDEQGFLIDEKGNYILDDEGKMVKLSPEHIEYLKESNMYEEQLVQK